MSIPSSSTSDATMTLVTPSVNLTMKYNYDQITNGNCQVTISTNMVQLLCHIIIGHTDLFQKYPSYLMHSRQNLQMKNAQCISNMQLRCSENTHHEYSTKISLYTPRESSCVSTRDWTFQHIINGVHHKQDILRRNEVRKPQTYCKCNLKDGTSHNSQLSLTDNITYYPLSNIL
jgi:hypothetical protein